MTKRCISLLTLFLAAFLLPGLALAYPVLAGAPARPPAQGGNEWIIWEMAQPPQSLLLDGPTLWLGSYKGGLYRWDVTGGYQAHYTATAGLAGEDITGLALNAEGRVLAAAVDGGLAEGSSGFRDLEAPGGGRAWDVAVAGGDTWLATLGGGVARYDGSNWTGYTTANSALPFDDVYAVAVEGSTPWIGTIGYGLARLESGDWISYTLPVDIPHPVTPTTAISNNAVVDIAVDGSGNKWLATDGAGVVVLDGSNANWTVYDTDNSGLPDNFVHSITLAGSDRWFGTLGGGAARLSGGSWEVVNTANSLLPDDDVLAVAIDANGGRWFATFDTGLAYHGPLPADPVSLSDVDPRLAPEYTPGGAKGYYLWLDPDTYTWHLAWSGDGQAHSFEGTIVANAPIISATASDFESGDAVSFDGGTLTIAATETISQDLVSFVIGREATQLTATLKIDGAYRPFNIQIGQAGVLPPTAPFRLIPPQPAPPEVLVEAETPLEEGDYAFVTGAFTDTDSPTGHEITWNMGDGTVITGTLAPPHSYVDEGEYQVTLTISDVHGEMGSAGLPITVNNVSPEVDFYSDPFRPEPGQVLTFTGWLYDPGAEDSHTYHWDFGDSSTSTEGLTVTHSYAATGTYDVTLTVIDDDGGTGVISYPVEIEPFGADFTGYPGVGLPPFTATLYDISSGLVTGRTWDFGDGSPAITTDTTTIDHLYETPGVYTVTLVITGPSGTDAISRPGYIVAVSPYTDGTIILEAEDYTRQLPGTGPTWETHTGRLGYSGSGYVQALPDVDVLFDDASLYGGSELQYELGLAITGTYSVWLRGYPNNAAGDSVYIGLNGQPITTTDYISEFPPGTWAWRQNLVQSSQPVTFSIDYPGIHTLYLWVREDGLSLDQIILTTDDTLHPGD